MKRNLFDELNEGLTALKSDREGKITLKKYTIEKKPARTIAFVAIRICKIPTH
jgi:putative transcriptional regulator